MRKLSPTSALENFILDLLYLFARLDANDTTKALAPPVEKMLQTLEDIDQQLRKAQKAMVLAQARRDHLDDALDDNVKRSGKLTEAVYGSQQSPQFKRIFSIAPSAIANLTWEEEISKVEVVATQLAASGEPMLVPLAAPLRAQAGALRNALDVFKATFTPIATVRADRDYQKVETNVLRERVYGQLIATFPGERARVEKFFRDSAEPTPPAAVPTVATDEVSDVNEETA